MSNLLHANTTDTTNSNVTDFESLLNDVSSIATKKSINVDYLPSVVTVIDAQTFLDAGIQNISQALDMLPGFQVQVSPMGYTITTVRGFKNPNAYFADKTLILIDGVPINNDVTGTASFYLDFPMHLVKKIEVLRGPASTMYGGGAYYGAVNIITKMGSSQKNNQIYVGGGSYGAITAGTNLFTTENGWNIFADGYAYSNNKALPLPGYGGDTDETTKDYSVGFKASKDGWEFLTRLKHETSGNYYSFEGELNPLSDRPENHTNIYFLSQLSNKTSFNDYELETKINYSHRNENVNANIASVTNSSSYAGTRLNGFYSIENIGEDNYGFESTLTLPPIASNDILIGVGVTYDVVSQDDYFSSVENAIVQSGNMSTLKSDSSFRYNQVNEPAYWLDPTATTILPSGISRTNVYGYAQDLISLTNTIDLILGLRFDNMSDVGNELSKRIGFVYRANDKTTLKLLYGSAYRAPTLTEKYALGHINLRMGDPDLKPEECNTYEAAMVYVPDFYNKFTLNFYYTVLHNAIDLEELSYTPYGYTQYPDRTSKGVEFEYFYKTSIKHNFYFNLSYTKTDYITPLDTHNSNQDKNLEAPDPSIVESMPDISPFMAKTLYIYKPTTAFSFGTAWRYFSQTTAPRTVWVVSDGADTPVKAANIFDETLTYHISPTSTLQITVKNIFNERVMQPAYYYYVNGGIQREGRNYLVSFVQNF
ncbi:TonB-dependent receptor [bacterium]|nr:TonB-dependent receptor [bacterium]MBU1884909.1 TonB-dependent receptor [bacterium]